MITLDKSVIAMIHTSPLPGTPLWHGTFKEVIDKALKEAIIYKKAGVDMVMLENMHDTPYLNRSVGPEITASMAILSYEVKEKTGLPCGIQILAGANKEALACAFSSGCDFVRCEGFVFSHIADEGMMNSCAGELLRYRKQIGADNIAIFTDIKKKHSSHAVTSDVDIAQTAQAAEFFRADGVIVTGSSTADAASVEECCTVKGNISIPLLIGSGLTTENIHTYYPFADGFIVGSHFKYNGKWQNELDPERISEFMHRINSIRKAAHALPQKK